METFNESMNRIEGHDLSPFIVSDANAVAETAHMISEVRNDSRARSEYLAVGSKNSRSEYAPLYYLLQAENLSELIDDVKGVLKNTAISVLSPVDRENRKKIDDRVRALIFKKMLVEFAEKVGTHCFPPDIMPVGPGLYASSFAAVTNTVYVAETSLQFGVAVSELVAADEVVLAYVAFGAVAVVAFFAEAVPGEKSASNNSEEMNIKKQPTGVILGSMAGADECRVLSELISRLACSTAQVESTVSDLVDDTNTDQRHNFSSAMPFGNA